MMPPDAAPAAASARSAVSPCRAALCAAEMGGAVRCSGAKKREFRLKMRKRILTNFAKSVSWRWGGYNRPFDSLRGIVIPPDDDSGGNTYEALHTMRKSIG